MEKAIKPTKTEEISILLKWFEGGEHDFFQWTGSDFTVANAEEKMRNNLNDNSIKCFSLKSSTDTLLGYVELHKLDPHSNWYRIVRLVINPSFRGKGLAGFMIQHLESKLLKEEFYFRLDLIVFVENVAAIGLYNKLGFLKEGTLKKAKRKGDHFFDILIMARIKDK